MVNLYFTLVGKFQVWSLGVKLSGSNTFIVSLHTHKHWMSLRLIKLYIMMTCISDWTGIKTKDSVKLLHNNCGSMKPRQFGLTTDNSITNTLKNLFVFWQTSQIYGNPVNIRNIFHANMKAHADIRDGHFSFLQFLTEYNHIPGRHGAGSCHS